MHEAAERERERIIHAVKKKKKDLNLSILRLSQLFISYYGHPCISLPCFSPFRLSGYPDAFGERNTFDWNGQPTKDQLRFNGHDCYR